jgi:nicotinamide-nucleotide amidase
MIIEMISTGDEVLQGDIADTNAAWVGRELNELGLKITRRQTVSDDMSEIIRALTEASTRADWVLVNGGLGPTSDDLSAAAAAQFSGAPLTLDQSWLDQLTAWFEVQGRSMPQSNTKQAMLPLGAECIDNPVGTACGFVMRVGTCQFLFTPGVPSEFKLMVTQQWLPRLKGEGAAAPSVKRFYTFGVTESGLNDRLSQLDLPQGVRLGYRSERPRIEVKVFAEHSTPQDARVLLNQQIRTILGDNLFSEDDGNWQGVIQQRMIARGLKLALAESCTGGLLASQLIHEAGSSAYLDCSFVTYSNRAKVQAIGVDEAILERFGAVSPEVAAQMAMGALTHSCADIALSITGIAGPDGGSDDKPVGSVCFGFATRDGVISQSLLLPNRGRTAIRVTSAAIALDMLRRYLADLPILGEYELIQRSS